MSICIQTYDILRDQLFRPIAKQRADYFKQQLLGNILQKKPYQLIENKHDRSKTFDDYIDNDNLPEYCFKDLTNNRKFWVEVENRSRWLGGYPDQYVSSIDAERLSSYRKYDAIRRMFLALTVGSENISCEGLEYYLVPIRFISYGDVLHRKMMQYFVIRNGDSGIDHPNSPLSSTALWTRFNWKHTTSAKEIQQ